MPDPLPQGSGTRTPEVLDTKQFDLRDDGSVKGLGFLGPFQMPDGGTAGEYSIAESEHLRDAKGQYISYPSLVPTLTRDEVLAVLKNAASKENPKPPLPDSVYDKAEAFALYRKAQGLPLFARPGEQLTLYPDIPRVAIRAPSGDITLPNESGQRDPRLGSLGIARRD